MTRWVVILSLVGVAVGATAKAQSPATHNTSLPHVTRALNKGPLLAGRTIAMPADQDVQHLVYVSARRALVSNGSMLTLVDTTKNKAVGTTAITVNDSQKKSDIPSYQVNAMQWRWAGEPIALLRVSATVDAPPAGIGVWRPLSEPSPQYATALGAFSWNCMPAALAPDGSRAAVIGCDAANPNISDITVIDTVTRQAIAKVTVPADAVHAVFAPDGKQLAFSTKNFEVGIFDRARNQTRMLPGPHNAQIRSLAFRAAEPRLAAGNSDNDVLVWNTTTGAHQIHQGSGDRVMFSSDGALLAVGSYGKLLVLDTARWNIAHQMVVDPAIVIRDLTWSPDNTQLAVLAYKIGLLVFDIRAATPGSTDDAWWARIKPIPAPSVGLPPPRDGSISGTVTLNGKAIVGLELTLKAQDAAPATVRTAPPPVARTDAHGEFHFDNVFRTQWQCNFAAPGAMPSGFGADLREQKSKAFTLALEPAVTLVGRVVDAAGQPAAGARVHYWDSDGSLILNIISDATGAFTHDHLRVQKTVLGANGQPRRLKLDVDRTDGSVAEVELDFTTPGRRELAIKLLSPNDKRVAKFIVVDSAGKPVPNATVVANEMKSRITDAHGRVSFVWEQREIEVRAYGPSGRTRERTRLKLPRVALTTLKLEPN